MTEQTNPAEKAAEQALEEMFLCIQQRQHFRLEAGAGAGKTYSLIKGLKLLISEQGDDLLRRGQQVACITYTNVATDEINARTDQHPAIHASTIHGFCWGIIADHQPFLWQSLPDISTKWREIFSELEKLGDLYPRKIVYSQGRRRIDEKQAQLSHDDILPLTVKLLEHPKFRHQLITKFPILFIDEYQDTDKEFAASLVKHFIAPTDNNEPKPLIGFFGDSWQKIYRTGAGLIEHENLRQISKQANFRSASKIVDALNRIRPELPQHPANTDLEGSIQLFHTNGWGGERILRGHSKNDLNPEDAHHALESVKANLIERGWLFNAEATRILMLTHKVMAEEQGYANLSAAFRNNDAFVKVEDSHVQYLVQTLEPVCNAYQNQCYGEMFQLLGANAPLLTSGRDKAIWSHHLQGLLDLQQRGTVGEVVDRLKQTEYPPLPDKLIQREAKLTDASDEELAASGSLQELQKLRDVPYQEIKSLVHFLNHHTPYSTKHGVKGAEFENVLIVLGRGWNLYDWDKLLSWYQTGDVKYNQDTMERNRNLFYVACSRPKANLAVLITQQLSPEAMVTLSQWFGEENINSLY